MEWDIGLTLDQLRVAILEKYPDAFDRSAASAASDGSEFDWDKPLKSNYRPLAHATIYGKLNNFEGDRSAIAYGLVRQLAQYGYTPEQAVITLMHHATLPVMEHYGDCGSDEFETRLRADIARAFTKPMEPANPPAAEVFRACATHGPSPQAKAAATRN